MNVLHLTRSVGPDSGGLGLLTLNLAKAQEILGLLPSIWTVDSQEQLSPVRERWDFDTRLLSNSTLGPSFVGFSPAAERLIGEQAGQQFQLIHQHGIWTAESRVTSRGRSSLNLPTIVAPQGSLQPWALRRSKFKKKLAWLAYERRNLVGASCLQALSSMELDDIRDFGLTGPVAIIPNGISHGWLDNYGDGCRFRQQYSIPVDKHILLFLSRIHPKKGLNLLFNAMAAIKDQLANWHLVIVGPDEVGHRQQLETLAEALAITKFISFIGPLYNGEKRDAFAAADLFVLPTYSEGAPLAILEALGAGLPVLTTHGTPWQELAGHSCGWWVSVNAEAIRLALQEAIQKPRSALEEMGQRGAELVRRKYTWAQVARQTIELYEWLLGERDKPDFVILD